MDIITQLQDQVNYVASLFFNFTGALQRDAPPVSLGGEPVVDSSKNSAVPAPPKLSHEDVKKQTKEMASALVQASLVIDELIDALPAGEESEEEQLALVESMLRENEEAGQALAKELALTEAKLSQVRTLFRMVVEEDLQIVHKGGALEQA